MPLVGFLMGAAISSVANVAASYVAIALLVAVGLYTVREALGDEEERAIEGSGSFRLFTTALAVSLDELAIGFSLGLLQVPLLLAAALIAVQAFLLTLIGTAIGHRVGGALAEGAELLSGIILTLLGLALLVEKLLGA